MNESIPVHQPVMQREVLEMLDPRPGDALLDLTLGTGGHALTLGAHLGPDGLVVGMDADEKALKTARPRLEQQLEGRVRLFHGRFSEADQVLKEVGIDGFDIVLADLGVGTHQLDDHSRGFSFDSEARLDMRFDVSGGLSAFDVVNRETEENLADIFYRLGQERYSRQIAAEICRSRRNSPIETPQRLAAIATRIYATRSRGRRWRLHPATRIFMALRIHVNDELGELEKLLNMLPALTAAGARSGIITYHSLEARLVKTLWRRQAAQGVLEIIPPAPAGPGESEIEQNPRARSAQLRAARFHNVQQN